MCFTIKHTSIFVEIVKISWTLDFEGGASNRTALQQAQQALQALRVLPVTKQATRQGAATVCSVEVSSAGVGGISNDIMPLKLGHIIHLLLSF